MEQLEEKWSGEEIAGVDAALKALGNTHEIALAIDRLFFAKNEKDSIPKLKAAAALLTQLAAEIPEGSQNKWRGALGKQLRQSVDRAKKDSGKK